jgi:hypothetical protein
VIYVSCIIPVAASTTDSVRKSISISTKFFIL